MKVGTVTYQTTDMNTIGQILKFLNKNMNKVLSYTVNFLDNSVKFEVAELEDPKKEILTNKNEKTVNTNS